MFDGSFGTYNSMVTLILTFDLSSGEIQVKEGQILKRKFFFKNIPILFNFVSGFQKCHFFRRTTIGNSKKRVSKMASLPLIGFGPFHSQKIKTLALNFHKCW